MVSARKWFVLLSVLLLLAIGLFSTVRAYSSKKEGSGEAPQKGPVVVASKIDTEGALLGQMIVHMLSSNDFDVVDKTEFGPTDVIRKAIINGEIDLYPEYTGNGGFFFNDADPRVWKDAKKGYATVKRLDLERNDIVWLTPAPANNTWAMAIRADLAESEGITTLEDFADYVNRGGRVKVACSEEFVSRPDALPAFEEAYGFKLAKDQLLILSGGNTAQTEKAAAEGIDGVNGAMAYGTDAPLAAFGLKVLQDNKGVQPVYEPTPIVREDVIKTYPEIAKILKPVFESLDLVTLQTLNAKIVIQGQNASVVAKEYLVSKGFLKP